MSVWTIVLTSIYEQPKGLTLMSLPVATIERVIKSAGVPRVAGSATNMIIAQAESYITDLAKKSYAYAKHAGRNTLKDTDVKAALGLVD